MRKLKITVIKKVLILLSFFVSVTVFAQHEIGTVQLRFGLGIGVYEREKVTTVKIGNTYISTKDTIAIFTNVIPVELLVGIGKNISFGLHYDYGNYIEDSNDAEIYRSIINKAGLTSDIYFINRKRFNMYLNAVLHCSFLNIHKEGVILVNDYKYRGIGTSFNLGTNVSIFSFLSLNMRLGYDGKNLDLTDWKINGNAQDLSDLSEKLKSKGFNAMIGLNLVF